MECHVCEWTTIAPTRSGVVQSDRHPHLNATHCKQTHAKAVLVQEVAHDHVLLCKCLWDLGEEASGLFAGGGVATLDELALALAMQETCNGSSAC